MLNIEDQRKIAKKRIEILLDRADNVFAENAVHAHRYVEIARKLAMKVNLRLPREQKRKFCKHCYRFLRPGVNATVRTRLGKLIIFCKECKKYTRIPLRKRKPPVTHKN